MQLHIIAGSSFSTVSSLSVEAFSVPEPERNVKRICTCLCVSVYHYLCTYLYLEDHVVSCVFTCTVDEFK